MKKYMEAIEQTEYRDNESQVLYTTQTIYILSYRTENDTSSANQTTFSKINKISENKTV